MPPAAREQNYLRMTATARMTAEIVWLHQSEFQAYARQLLADCGLACKSHAGSSASLPGRAALALAGGSTATRNTH